MRSNRGSLCKRHRFVLAASSVLAALFAASGRAALIAENYVGSTGGDWNTAGNWSGDVVPINAAETYAVTISSIDNVAYDVSGSNAIDTLNLETSAITLDSGDNLTINSSATLSAAAVTANNASFNAPSVTSFDASNLYANTGGNITLSSVSTYTAGNANTNNDFVAIGTGAQVNLSDLTTINVPNGAIMTVDAANGGEIDLSGLATVNQAGTPSMVFLVNGAGSTLKLNDAATNITGATIEVQNSGNFSWGTTNTDVSNIIVESGSSATLPNLTSYTTANANTFQAFQAQGSGSRLNLSNLTTLNLVGAATFSIEADDGGIVDLSGLTTINHSGTRVISFQAVGTGSTLKIPALGPALNQIDVDVETGGAVQWGTPTAFTNSELYVNSNPTIDTTAISNADGSSLFVDGGGTLSFPSLIEYTAPDDNSFHQFNSRNAGSVLDLGNLTRVNLPSMSSVGVYALSGGMVDMHSLNTINHTGAQAVSYSMYFESQGAGSLIDLSSLISMPNSADQIDIEDDGQVELGGFSAPFTLSFSANFQSTDGPLNVYYEGALIETISPNNLNTWQDYSYDLTNLSFGPNPTITFEASGPNASMLMDLYQVTLDVPEPAIMAMLIPAAGLAFLRRRRQPHTL